LSSIVSRLGHMRSSRWFQSQLGGVAGVPKLELFPYPECWFVPANRAIIPANQCGDRDQRVAARIGGPRITDRNPSRVDGDWSCGDVQGLCSRALRSAALPISGGFGSIMMA
jgi:hypothetical protein